MGSWPGCFLRFATAVEAASRSAWTAAPRTVAIRAKEYARCLALLVVEPTIAIAVELFHQGSFLPHTTEAPRPLAALTGTKPIRTRRRRPLESGRSVRRWKGVLWWSLRSALRLSQQGRGERDQDHESE